MMPRPPLHRPAEMGDDDAELMAAACALLAQVHEPGRHEVVAAFRLVDGGVQLGVHVDGSARRSAVCAEGAAAANVFAHAAGRPGAAGVTAMVSVLRRPEGTTHVIEPCGVCAELLSDYWPRARVWITRGDDVVPAVVEDLLPAKRRRRW